MFACHIQLFNYGVLSDLKTNTLIFNVTKNLQNILYHIINNIPSNISVLLYMIHPCNFDFYLIILNICKFERYLSCNCRPC